MSNSCSLVQQTSGICSTCPNKEECNLRIILAMQDKLNEDTYPTQTSKLFYNEEWHEVGSD